MLCKSAASPENCLDEVCFTKNRQFCSSNLSQKVHLLFVVWIFHFAIYMLDQNEIDIEKKLHTKEGTADALSKWSYYFIRKFIGKPHMAKKFGFTVSSED